MRVRRILIPGWLRLAAAAQTHSRFRVRERARARVYYQLPSRLYTVWHTHSISALARSWLHNCTPRTEHNQKNIAHFLHCTGARPLCKSNCGMCAKTMPNNTANTCRHIVVTNMDDDDGYSDFNSGCVCVCVCMMHAKRARAHSRHSQLALRVRVQVPSSTYARVVYGKTTICV